MDPWEPVAMERGSRARRSAEGGSHARTPRALRVRRARQRRRQYVAAGLLAIGVAAVVAAASMAPSGNVSLNTSTHQHPHLQVFLRGVPVPIPVNIGIDPALYNDHTFDEFGGMDTMSPLHTHEGDGTIHLEMSRWHPFTLGDFFRVWGEPFGADRLLDYAGPVTMTVDGEPNGDYGSLVLQDGQEIVLRGG